MTSPTTMQMYGQMQHEEYEAQAAKRYPVAQKGQKSGDGLIMGKIADLLENIREQIAHQKLGETVALNQASS